MRSYKPEELFDDDRPADPEFAELRPKGDRRMGANPARERGRCCSRIWLARFSPLRRRGAASPARSTPKPRACSEHILRDVMKPIRLQQFPVVGPDETASNRLDALFEVTDRVSTAEISPPTIMCRPTGG